VEQQDPRQPNPEAMAMAQQVASYGRGGDKLLLHVRPDELQGLASMLTITINPETGMPEAFLKGLRRAVSRVTKPIRKITKSKAFKTIAPIALAIAAPYVLPQLAAGVGLGTVGVGGAAGTGLAGFLGGSSIGAAALTTGLGSLTGNLLAGRKFGDAAKAALISGATFHSPTKLHLGATNGFMYQGSQSGSVFGPPIIAAIVTQTGKWESAGWLLFSLTCISLIAVFLMRKYEKRIEDKC